MRRREFIAGLGSAAAWPALAHAQQGDRVRHIGVLMALDENDPEGKRRYSAFAQALGDLDWTESRNVRTDLRWGGDINRIRDLAQELVGLHPDIIVTNGGAATVACQRETRTIPIVFTSTVDPVYGEAHRLIPVPSEHWHRTTLSPFLNVPLPSQFLHFFRLSGIEPRAPAGRR